MTPALPALMGLVVLALGVGLGLGDSPWIIAWLTGAVLPTVVLGYVLIWKR